jgi:hypothetical protein
MIIKLSSIICHYENQSPFTIHHNNDIYPEAYPSPSHWWYPFGPILLVGDFELVLPAKRPMVSCDICAGGGGIRTCKLAMPKHGHAYLMNKGPHSSEVLKGFRPTRLHSSLVSFQDMIHMIEHTTTWEVAVRQGQSKYTKYKYNKYNRET